MRSRCRTSAQSRAAVLSSYDVVILARCRSSAAQVTMFSDWVTAGGNLIAMRPDKKLAVAARPHRCGHDARGRLSAGQHLRGAGRGHRRRRRCSSTARPIATRVSGATSIATLYSNRDDGDQQSGVTMRTVGTAGGQAAAFAYDLARSVVYTRQGNPAWSGQERDGSAADPVRRSLLWGGDASRLGRSDEGRDPAGR